MRLAKASVLLATFALAACSGTVRGTGGTPDGGHASGFENAGGGGSAGGGCTTLTPCDTSVTDPSATAAPSEYDRLFTTPASATVTSSSLDGVWAGSMAVSHDAVRLVITASAITIAVRCGSGGSGAPKETIGVTVKAVTSSTSIRTLEDRSLGGSAGCQIKVRPQTFGRCSTASAGPVCFDLRDSGLDFGPSALFTGDPYGHEPAFSKMSDGT